jgi:hypothetical protein
MLRVSQADKSKGNASSRNWRTDRVNYRWVVPVLWIAPNAKGGSYLSGHETQKDAKKTDLSTGGIHDNHFSASLCVKQSP